VPVSIGFRFVTGAYHATAWDQAVNNGASEWPPSSWRILRALLSTWHTRLPDLPAERVEHLLATLSADPPHYRLPATMASHTRHYLPGAGHRSDEQGGTSLTLDPQLHVNPDDVLIAHWPDVHLDPDDTAALAALVAEIPYLGRAESRCQAELLTEESDMPKLDCDNWSVPADEGGDLRVLTPEPSATRAQLETTPDAMRKAKRLTPAGARWVGYRQGAQAVPAERGAASQTREPYAVRWVLDSRAPFRAHHGILATTGLRGAVLGALGGGDRLAAEPRGWLIAGPHDEAIAGEHQHAHWWWIADGHGDVRELLLWVPGGIPTQWVGRVASVRGLPDFQDAPKGYRPGAALHLQTVGELSAVCPPAILATATRWRTDTPMLTERFPKKNGAPEAFIRREVERELAYRAHWWPKAPTVKEIRVINGWEDRDVVAYRRYRWKETMASRRRGFDIEVEFEQELTGPLSLGALSHFGFGLFEAMS
jgi:CRISPR-associated protein Csb2